MNSDLKIKMFAEIFTNACDCFENKLKNLTIGFPIMLENIYHSYKSNSPRHQSYILPNHPGILQSIFVKYNLCINLNT